MTLRDESRWPSMWGAGQEPVRLPSLSATAQPVEEEWRYEAACAGNATNLFFPVGTSAEALAQEREAKQVCATCSVMAECLEFAMETGQQGVWGGTNDEERRRLRKNQRRAAARRAAKESS
ncbi:WhiB family transcriptional regulator [Streptomyces sp. NPDC048179]|uniref:WhiB family transcriptional regulator n=1 Tax=Streptomyces sp. NPDC048179 TaxID=3365506 RepID=UPI003714CCBF